MNLGIRTDRGDGTVAIVRAIVGGVDHRIELPADDPRIEAARELERAVAADLGGRTDEVTTAKIAEAEAVERRKGAERRKREDDAKREAAEQRRKDAEHEAAVAEAVRRAREAEERELAREKSSRKP